MANENEYIGLLSQLGMGQTREQLAEEAFRRNQATNLALVGNMGYTNPIDRSGGQLGGLLASAVGRRGWKPDAAQESKLRTAQEAQAEMEKWAAANPDVSDKDRASKYEEFLAAAAFRNGLPDVGSQLLQSIDARKAAIQKRDLELENLGIERDIKRDTKQAEISKKLIEAGKEGIVEFWAPGSNNPNSGKTGRFNPVDGSVTGPDGTVYKVGQWTSTRPQQIVQYGRGGGGGGDSALGINKSEAAEVRKTQRAAHSQMLKALAIDDLFLEATNNGQPINFTADVGKLASFSNRWVNTAADLAQALAPTGVMGAITLSDDERQFNLDSAEGRAAFSRKYADEIRDVLPKELKRNAAYADRYASLVIEFAYATARAAEPGAKALTKEDFMNAVKTIGGGLTDPESLRKIMFNRALSTTAELDFNLSQYTPEMQAEILAPKAVQDYQATLGEITKRLEYSKDTGQALGSSYDKTAPQFTVKRKPK